MYKCKQENLWIQRAERSCQLSIARLASTLVTNVHKCINLSKCSSSVPNPNTLCQCESDQFATKNTHTGCFYTETASMVSDH